MDALANKLVLVTRRSRLEELVTRYNTLEQARFYIDHLGGEFAEYEAEHQTYQKAIRQVEQVMARFGRVQRLDRSFLPNFIFPPNTPVVVLGPDGLVANTLKYLDRQPVIGVNPDHRRYDGVLLPFKVSELPRVIPAALEGRLASKAITMAQAQLQDGRSLYAVNDLFIGMRSHVSARYEIAMGSRRELQSSSGIIVSTGLGSSGWLRSVMTGAAAIAGEIDPERISLAEHGFAWDAQHLFYTVREPFPSLATQATLVFGQVSAQTPLQLRSQMGDSGVIFSDGIEADCLEFTAGQRVTIKPAARSGVLLQG